MYLCKILGNIWRGHLSNKKAPGWKSLKDWCTISASRTAARGIRTEVREGYEREWVSGLSSYVPTRSAVRAWTKTEMDDMIKAVVLLYIAISLTVVKKSRFSKALNIWPVTFHQWCIRKASKKLVGCIGWLADRVWGSECDRMGGAPNAVPDSHMY